MWEADEKKSSNKNNTKSMPIKMEPLSTLWGKIGKV